VKGSKAIPLFIVGIILVILTFPIAWNVSAGLGYALGVAAVVLGAYLIGRRGGRTLPLVLGVVLVVLAVLALAGTAVIHMGLWALSTAMQSATQVKTLHARVKELIKAGSWEVAVLNVSKARYVVSNGNYYAAGKGYEVVVITLMVRNAGSEAKPLADIWNFILVTESGRSYSSVLPVDLKYVPPWNLNSSVKYEALTVRPLNAFGDVAPGTYVDGDVMFKVPAGEEPVKLYFRVGVIGGYRVVVSLK